VREIKNLQLQSVTFHIVGNRDGRPPVLATQKYPLTADPRIADYLKGHIRASLDDPQTRGASFASDASVSAVICTETIDGTRTFVDGSRALADRLHRIVVADQRIEPGDLAVCLFADADRPAGPRYLALLKLDQSEAYRLIRRTDAHGVEYAAFEIAEDILPGKDARLHKCAFVQRPTRPGEYALQLLDRQLRGDQARVVARFFAETFLEATVDEDCRTHTLRLRAGLVNARNAVGRDFGEDAARAVDAALRVALSSERFDVDDQVGRLAIPPPARAVALREVRKLVPNREVEIDPAYARQQLNRRRRFVGSHGLRVSMEASRYPDLVKQAERIPSHDGADFWRIVVETETWTEER
jgi:37-kD nucleoid-associated bacterial protein